MVILLLIFISFLIDSVNGTDSRLDQIIRSHWENFRRSPLATELRKDGPLTNEPRKKPIHVCEHDEFMKRSRLESPYSMNSRQLLEDWVLLKKRDLEETDALNFTTPNPSSQPVPSPSQHSSPNPNPNPNHNPNHNPNPNPSSVPNPSPSSSPASQNSSSWAPIRMYPNLSWINISDPLSCTSVGQVVQVDQYYTNSNGQSTDQYTCKDSDLLTSAKVSYLTDHVIPTVLYLVNQIISVQSVQGNLVLSKDYHAVYGTSCRTNIVIPDFMINGPGQPNADYYLMLSARPNPNPTVLANALPCSSYFIGSRFDRPLAGSINFNPGSSSLLDDSSDYFTFAQNIKTALHEITHALGFTADLYIDYRTPQGGFYKDPVINATYNVVGYTWKLTTPRVLAFAQQHYNCSSLDGMELEEWGSPITVPGSHWEDRLVDSEYMAPISSSDSQLSYLTLGLFEDTGWYIANTSMAEPWHYGVMEGCDWVQKPCSAATWNRYWCDNPSAQACNGHRTAKGHCNLVTYASPLPVQFQYFSQNTLGGSNNWNNFCPVYDGYSNTFCHDPNGLVGLSNNPYGETFGNESSCWDLVGAQQSSACFPTRCSTQSGTNTTILIVNINGGWVVCPTAGGNIEISVNGESITLICPFVEFFCSELPGNTVQYTFDSSQNIPVTDAPTVGNRSGPSLPDNPSSPPSGGVPPLLPPIIPQLLDEWGLYVGSTLFYVLIGIGALIVLIFLGLCCCRRSKQ